MQSMMKRMVLAAFVLLAPAVLVHAGNGNPIGKKGGRFAKQHPRRNEVNKRVRNQRGRINAGVKSGKLTQQQANQLRSNDRAIKQQEHADVKANGGTLTKGEQQQINKEENANSQLIKDEKNPAGQ